VVRRAGVRPAAGDEPRLGFVDFAAGRAG